MTRALGPKKIKSAQRALEVLEYFQRERGEATVMEIARAMGYPQSSTSELLSCLVALGYLKHNRAARCYEPTARVAVLGAWVQPSLFRDGRLLSLMDHIADEAEAVAVLGQRLDLNVQILHAVAAKTAGIAPPGVGSQKPLPHSAMGRVMLAAMDRGHVRKLMHRHNADSAEDRRVIVESLCAECDGIDAVGYADSPDHNAHMIAMLLPSADGQEALALGLRVTSRQWHERGDHFVQLLRGAIARLAGGKSAQEVPAHHTDEPASKHAAH